MIKRSEKGSITLFTLIAMIFFLTISFTAYTSAMIKLQAQNEDLERIKASYEQDLTEEGLASLYEELTTNKPYTVTFDANGGTVDLPSKEVKYGKEYGNLPVPTRDGYKFMGWNGKNLAEPINEENYSIYNHYNYTNTEFIENNETYTRVNGIQSNNRLDTAWYFLGNNIIRLSPSKIYNLNFNVRSLNSVQTSSFALSEKMNATGYTGIYENDAFVDGPVSVKLKLLKSIDNSINYDNDGSWHKVNTTITVPSNVNEAKLAIGNDNPDLYGKDSYIDIANLQLEEGTEATEYEPYYITKDTKVTQKKDHILKAIWEEGVPPTLELSKETYIEEDFSNWTLNNAKIIEEDGKKVLLIGENGNAGSAISNYYETQGERWVPYYETYTTIATNEFSDKGGSHSQQYYYNQNHETAKDWRGHSVNGVAFPCELNKWISSTVDGRFQLSTKYISGYGNDIKYIKFSISSGNRYSQSPVKIRNFKMIGDAIPNSFYNINITSSDNVGVTTTKYAKGEQTAEYFKTNGTNVENNQIRVTENGIYTVCVGDKAENMTTKTIEITNIQ